MLVKATYSRHHMFSNPDVGTVPLRKLFDKSSNVNMNRFQKMLGISPTKLLPESRSALQCTARSGGRSILVVAAMLQHDITMESPYP